LTHRQPAYPHGASNDAAPLWATDSGPDGRVAQEVEQVSFTAPERETVIVFNDEDELASVYTSQRAVITRLKKNPAASIVDEGRFGGSPWAEFELPKRFVTFRSKERTFDGEERQRRAAVLNAARKTAAGENSADSDRGSSAATPGEGE
jgi:hypothetical protein